MNLEEMNPAEMLSAVMNDELSLDGEALESKRQTPEPTDEPTDKPEDATEANNADKAEPEGAPIASKSGGYTIPYEKLAEARDRAKNFEAENEQLKQLVQELSAKQQANFEQAQASADYRASTGQAATAADANLQAAQAAIEGGADAEVFGDFSEEALAKGIATLQARGRDAMKAELLAEIHKELQPIKQQKAQAEADAHYSSIYSKHQDADDIVQSSEFATWREGLPAFMRAGMEDALKNGTAQQIIEVFDAFKQATAPQNPKAKPVLEVQRKVPNSLSEIAGEPHRDMVQQTLETAQSDPASLLTQMHSMTPEQIDRLLSQI